MPAFIQTIFYIPFVIFFGDIMLEAVALDNFVIKKDKGKDIEKFLNFARKNRKYDKEFEFSREDCYDPLSPLH